MRRAPVGERAIALAFIEGEGGVDLAEAALRELDGLDHGARAALPVARDHALARRRQQPFRGGPAGRGLPARDGKRDKLVGERRAVAERKALELTPIHVALRPGGP